MGYFRAPDDIFDLPISANAKLILLNLCRRANKTGSSFPSRKKIASDCSMSVRTVDKFIMEIESNKKIMKNKKTGKSNTYQLCDDYLSTLKLRKVKDQPGKDLRKGGAGFAHVPEQNLHPKEEQIKEYPSKEVDKDNLISNKITNEYMYDLNDAFSLSEQEIEKYMQDWRSMSIEDRKDIDIKASQRIPFGSKINITGAENALSNKYRALALIHHKKI